MIYKWGLLLVFMACNHVPKTIAENDKLEKGQIETEALTVGESIREPVYRSLDYGKTWQGVSEGLNKDLQVSFFEKKGEKIVMATDNGGLFISDQDKSAWKQISDHLPGLKITALYVSQEEIYAGVYKKGIYLSRDEGKTWLSLNSNLVDLNVRAILKINDELLVATDIGIFKSEERQKRWKKVFDECQVVSLNAEKDKIVGGAVYGILFSDSEGERWNWIQKEGAAHNTAIIDGNIIAMNISGDLFSSGNWGKNWKTLQYGPREGSYVYEIERVGEHWIFSNNYGIHQSKDKGVSSGIVYMTEDKVFFDFVVFDKVIYGGTRPWNEYRKKTR